MDTLKKNWMAFLGAATIAVSMLDFLFYLSEKLVSFFRWLPGYVSVALLLIGIVLMCIHLYLIHKNN